MFLQTVCTAFLTRVFVSAVTLAVLAGCLSGCSMALNDGAKSNVPLKLTLPQADCLAQAMPLVQKYFEGTSSVQEVNQVWDCAHEAVTSFTSNTSGKSTEYYTPQEIRKFLETYFLGDLKISDGLLEEAMRVKQILIGGSIDKVTREEWSQSHSILQTLRTESLRLHPYIDIYMQNLNPDDAINDRSRVEVGLQTLQISAINIGSLFSRVGIVYETANLKRLLTESKPLFKNWEGPDSVIKYLSTFEVAKALLLNGAGNQIAAMDWAPLLTHASELYTIYLRAHLLMSKQDLMVAHGLTQLNQVIEDVSSIIRRAIDNKPGKVIKFAQLDSVVDEVTRLKLLDLEIRHSTMKKVVRVIITKVLTTDRKARPSVEGLTLISFNKLHAQVRAWLDMQREWEQMSAIAFDRDPKLRGQAFSLSLVRELWPKVSSPSKQAHDDLNRLFARTTPIVFAANQTVVYDRRFKYFSQSTFNHLNWKALVIRAIMTGYPAAPLADLYSGITKRETKEFYDDFHELGTDLKFVKADDFTLWDTSFEESNMFMPSAVTNDKLSYNEAFDFLSMTVGGAVMTDRLYDDLVSKCRHVGVDHFSRPMTSAQCTRERNRAMFATTYRELPSWVYSVSQLDAKGFADLQASIESATRDNGVSNEAWGKMDLIRVTMVLQYIESLFLRFDLNATGTIDYEEAQHAFPLFAKILGQASGFKTDRQNFALFCYLLKYGHAPESIADKIYYKMVWEGSESRHRQVNAGRIKILGIVSSLANAAKK